MPNDLITLIKVAEAGLAAAMKARSRGLIATDKDETLGAHYSTNADDDSQAVVITMLRQIDPMIPIVAEEQENSATLPAKCWIIDPNDGTTNLLNGSLLFGVIVGLFEHGVPARGVIALPDGTIIAAAKGKGCWINGVRHWMRHAVPIDKTIIGMDIGPWTPPEVLTPLMKRFCMHSLMAAVWGTYEVLMGTTGAYLNLNIAKIWDGAVGALAVAEAGGVVCGLDGSPLKWGMRMDWIFAANETLADEMVAITKNWKPTK